MHNLVAQNVALSFCDKGQQWRRALVVTEDLQDNLSSFDGVSLGAVELGTTSDCRDASLSYRAHYDLLQCGDQRPQRPPDLGTRLRILALTQDSITYNSILGTLERAALPVLMAGMRHRVDVGVAGERWRRRRQGWEVGWTRKHGRLMGLGVMLQGCWGREIEHYYFVH